MKRWKKVLIILVCALVISQIPFSYRRYELAVLQAAIEQMNAERSPTPDARYVEYTGVIHVHSFLGGHSEGRFEEIIQGAKANQLDFVVMTEHPAKEVNTASMTLKGVRDGILFVNGNELSAKSGERLLSMPGDESSLPPESVTVEELTTRDDARGGLSFVAYPADFQSWTASGYDGVEVYNVYTNARQMNVARMFFDSLWSYRSYPDLLFARFYARPDLGLQRWDEALGKSGRRLTAIAGNDAHSNIGFGLNDSAGQPLIGLSLDPYERSFRLVRVHVLVPAERAFDAASLLEALREGHCFIGFDVFGDSSGFRFSASGPDGERIQGDEISLKPGLELTVDLPVVGRVVLFKNGQRVQDEANIKRKQYPVTENGVYRVEVYPTRLPRPVHDKPWIISNPIYVR